MLQATYGEYLSQLTGGIALSHVEVLRPADLGMSDAEVAALATPAVRRLTGNGNALRMAIPGHLSEGRFGEAGLAGDPPELTRDQFRNVAEDHKAAAHQGHSKDKQIPQDGRRGGREKQ